MHLLYLDDAGSVGNKDEQYFVLGGISIFEAQADYITREMDLLAEKIDPQNPYDIEFHASEIYARRTTPWKNMTQAEARGIIKAVLQIFAKTYETARAFACAIEKSSYSSAVELAFEDICKRFDLYLQRMRAEGEHQRGLLILDESSHEKTLQTLARDFRRRGTRWGGIHNIADIPFFVNSRASRLIQLADAIAYSVFRRYNSGDSQYLDIIVSKFDQSEGILHGLVHKQLATETCWCPACASRRTP
jgi:hypothetical protein